MTDFAGRVPFARDHSRITAATRIAAAALLPLISVPMFVGSPAQAAAPTPPVYSLAATVAPAAMTLAECLADPACIRAAAPSGSDDHSTLEALVNQAKAKVVPAVLDAAGEVVTPAVPATVLLDSGTYKLSEPLKLPPNVNLRGRGITATTVSMITANASIFNYGYLISWDYGTKLKGSSNLVSDLTVNGNCREGAGAPVPQDMPGRPGQNCDFRSSTVGTNAGGGIAVSDRWTVRQVRFTNLEYFKVWIGDGAKDVRIVDNRFDNWGGAESGDEDNVGGGSRNDNVVVEYNQFDKTIRGNSFDFTNAIRTTVRNNTVRSDGTIATARGSNSLYGNMYLEGLVDATVSDNLLHGAQITLKSNSGYTHVGENKDITNPRNTVVSGNQINYAGFAGIVIAYDDYKDADGTGGAILNTWERPEDLKDDHWVRPGGNNVIRDNVVQYSGRSGIMVIGSQTYAKNAADTITGNTVSNSGWGGSTAYDTGAGIVDTSGISLSIGSGDKIYGNTIADDPAKKTTWYGVNLGARRGPTTPTGTVLTGPAGETNTTANLIAAPLHKVALTPDPPVNLTATSGNLSWEESYPLDGRPVAGYKIFRNGEVVGDMPVGSAAVPGNLLTADESSFENPAAGTAGWTAGSRTTLARVDTGAVGTGAMSLTSSGTGEVSIIGKKMAATPGQVYTSVISAQAQGAGRWVRAGLKFTNAAGKVTNLATSNRATVDATTGWMTSNYIYTAPADAVSVQAWYLIEGTVAGEKHLVDRIGLVAGARTEQWSEANPPAGTSVYHVVAYTAQDNSTTASTVVNR
ncbi:hypothetical protein [Actinoplanes sp. NPDC051859]|uniref:hypothetical protein n=1 Tax=Actinoplanes sp. NPDC051859 TaxID=3363909 RepID=UPI0037A09173